MRNLLIVAETFYSLQCEGSAIGTPAVFLRLGGCNLLCKGKGWICDTIDVWQKGKATEFEDVLSTELIINLKHGAHLVLTGGEPLLQQDAFSSYLDFFRQSYGFLPFIEVETNATVMPTFYMEQVVKKWNVSPKLTNSEETLSRRYNEAVLAQFDYIKNSEVIFKFVVANEGDILEALQDFGHLSVKKFMFMPAGSSREELDKVRLEIVTHCIQLGIRYSERLHIVIWNQKTGV